MKTISTEDHAAQIDLLSAPGVPDGYTVKLNATAAGLAIEVERSHGEGASSWDFFEFSVPLDTDFGPLPPATSPKD